MLLLVLLLLLGLMRGGETGLAGLSLSEYSEMMQTHFGYECPRMIKVIFAGDKEDTHSYGDPAGHTKKNHRD